MVFILPSLFLPLYRFSGIVSPEPALGKEEALFSEFLIVHLSLGETRWALTGLPQNGASLGSKAALLLVL